GVKSSTSAASVPCNVCRPSTAKVRTPSAVLPSSSTLTLDKLMVPPTTLVRALIANRPEPPPGNGFCPAHTNALRSEAASAASVPSIFRVGLKLIAPSNAAFIGAPETRSFSPLRLPLSAAAKSPSVRLASTGESCQMKRPVAPKLFEIDGQAKENSTPYNVSLNCRSSSRITTVPPSIRISENAAGRCVVVWLRINDSMRPDQLDRPFG